jgi:hypothetical protein
MALQFARMDARMERQAKNEAVFRAVNREIANASEELGQRELEVPCECGRGGCEELLVVPGDVYDRVHQQRDRFLVAAGHETPQIERVVETTSNYVVVDKFAEAADLVEREETDGQ